MARARSTRRAPARARGKKAAAPDDPLAQLPHAAAARARWAEALADALAQGEPCTLALVDVDGFAGHVEQLGVERARALLAEVARRLEGRLSDRAHLGRLAGDLFGVALPGVDLEPALGVLELVREAVARTAAAVGRGPARRKVAVTVSAGLAAAPRDGGDLAALLEQARGALWRAKTLGGNRLGLPARERMVLKTSYYPQGQLEQLKRLAQRRGIAEAVLLREALDDLFLKHKDQLPST
ncbi:MAG: diguanylate cyclase [Planctomycetes bacterium]|nr:diguanylate cyclase [Planctomycetota bacterium]